MRLCGAGRPPARWKPWPLTFLPMSTALALWSCGTTPALPPDEANSGRPKRGTSSRSLVRIDRAGPTPAESVEWNTAARRVRLPSTGSSMTMSAWLRPAWGRARGWLSTFTNSAGRLIRPSKAPSTPVSGATGGGGAVVVVVGGRVVVVVGGRVVVVGSGASPPRSAANTTTGATTSTAAAPSATRQRRWASSDRTRSSADIRVKLVGGVADVGDGRPAPASVPDGVSDSVVGRGPAGERRRPVVPRGDPHVPRGQPGAGVPPRPGPRRLGIGGRGLAGPAVIPLGPSGQAPRFLPPIVAGEELWCQCYSE